MALMYISDNTSQKTGYKIRNMKNMGTIIYRKAKNVQNSFPLNTLQ